MELTCKCCGGAIAVMDNPSFGKCEYCGTLITLPVTKDSEILSLHARANRLRMNCEFDRAIGVYEDILNKDENDAEAHWGVLLSRYGIEYVEDPLSKRRIPTCHRIQRTSILIDEDYQAALKNAPNDKTKLIYEEQAKEIYDIQQNYLMISGKEGPTDIFISYKDSTNDGERTEDSVLAEDIYELLTNRGYHVFFSRVTLENKPGIQFEPYIFSALATAQVMLVIGTCRENFEAVWVRNEWSRYIDQLDDEEVLIPCYKGMSVSDLPAELANFQSLDMNRIGFKQDLIHAVERYLGSRQSSSGVGRGRRINTAGLSRRAMLFLEDGELELADQYAEQVLDEDPECAQAYIVKFMLKHQIRSESDISTMGPEIADDPDFKKILRFGDDETSARFTGYMLDIKNRIIREQAEEERRKAEVEKQREEKRKITAEEKFETGIHMARMAYIPSVTVASKSRGLIGLIKTAAQKSKNYEFGKALANNGNSVADFERAIDALAECRGYEDADLLLKKCQEMRSAYIKRDVCVERMKTAETAEDYSKIQTILEECKKFVDVDDKIKYCQSRIDSMRPKCENVNIGKNKEKKKHGCLGNFLWVIGIMFALGIFMRLTDKNTNSTTMSSIKDIDVAVEVEDTNDVNNISEDDSADEVGDASEITLVDENYNNNEVNTVNERNTPNEISSNNETKGIEYETNIGEENVKYVDLVMYDYKFSIPSYWSEEGSKEDYLQFYAEKGDKVAMLCIASSKETDDDYDVSLSGLHADNDNMMKVAASMVSEGNVYEVIDFKSDDGVEGVLYRFNGYMRIHLKKYAVNGLHFCFPSPDDRRWFFVNLMFTDNVERYDYEDEFLKILSSIQCEHIETNEHSTLETSDCDTEDNRKVENIEYSSFTEVDFDNAESFEAALNRGENVIGKTVRFKVNAVKPDSILGFNCWAGEHLNFVSADPFDVSEGDTLIAEIVSVKTRLGSWVIKYNLVP